MAISLREYLSKCDSNLIEKVLLYGPQVFPEDVEHLYDQHEDEIWHYTYQCAQKLGFRNILDLLSSYSWGNMVKDERGLKKVLTFFVIEGMAKEICLGESGFEL